MANQTVLDPRANDLTGRTFGLLTVVKPTIKRLRTYVVWECKCACGTIIEACAVNLIRNNHYSCGCQRPERASTDGREYSIWTDMRNRCSNPRNKRFDRYGGRGIRVCSQWDRFDVFLSNMGKCPSRHTLDRIDNDGNYEPGNCRWATYQQQHTNMSRNRRLTLNGRTMCLSEWARENGLTPDAVYARIKLGWSAERAITQPIRPMSKRR